MGVTAGGSKLSLKRDGSQIGYISDPILPLYDLLERYTFAFLKPNLYILTYVLSFTKKFIAQLVI